MLGSLVAILASLKWGSNSKRLNSKHYSLVIQGINLLRSNFLGVVVQGESSEG